MQKKKVKGTLTPRQKKMADLIHKWAYTDPQKEPKKADRLFKRIWEMRFGRAR